MRLVTRLVLLAALLACTTWSNARAMMAFVSDNERVAMADLIVVATVATTKTLDGVPASFGGEITLTVTSTLKGTAPATVRVRHAVPPPQKGGMIMMDHGGLQFAVGDRRLFFLTAFLDGYSIVGGGQGALAPEEAQKYAALIKDYPATITLAPLAGALTLGDKVKVTVTITNQGKTALQVYNPMLVGFVLGADQKTPLYLMAREDGAAPKDGYGKVPAGGKLEIAVTLATNERAGGDLGAKAVKWPVRLNLYLMPEGGQPGAGWNATSAVQTLEVTAAPAAAPAPAK